MDTHDPGEPYDGPPPRRRRDYRRESEYDDAWAAADEAGDFDEDIDPGAMVAGATWEDREPYALGSDDEPLDDASGLGPLPPGTERLYQRGRRSREDRLRRRMDPSQTYDRSPSYQRYQTNPGVRASWPPEGMAETPKRKRDRLERDEDDGWHAPGFFGRLPFWGVLLIVGLSVMALLAVAMACLSITVLLG